jgi:hypothetical protein
VQEDGAEEEAEEMRARYVAARAAIEDGIEDRSLAYQRVMHELYAVQRRAVVHLRNGGEISNDVMHRIERELDLEESRLEVWLWRGEALIGLQHARASGIIGPGPDPEVVKMCREWRTRHERRQEARFDEELRYLLDESERSEPPAPMVEHERDEQPADPERVRVEAATRA